MNFGDSPQGSSHEFSDIDQFREHLTGWDTEVTQLGRGTFGVGWDQILFEDLVLAHLRVKAHCTDVSVVDPGVTAIVVTLAPSLRTCGLEVDQGCVIIMRGGREHRSTVPEGWESLEITAANQVVEELGLLEKANLPADLPPERSILPLGEAYVRAFRALARNLRMPLQLEGEVGDRLMFARAIRERTLELLVSGIESSAALRAGTVAIRRIPRYDLAAKALLVIDAGCNAPDVDGNVSGSLAKIAEIIGTTPRAIQYAFRSALGITPYQYILARRLHCVRHDLRINGRGRAPVTEAAFDYGFFDLGRFARHYQRLFCEAPSQTLARARKSSVSASMPIA